MRNSILASCLLLSLAPSPSYGLTHTPGQRAPTPEHVYPLAQHTFHPSVTSASPRIEATPGVLLATSGDYRGEQIVAFDRQTSRVLWTFPAQSADQESSKDTLIGAAVGRPDVEIAVVLRMTEAARELQGLDARTGALRWRFSFPPPTVQRSLPTVGVQSRLVWIVGEGDDADNSDRAEWRATFLDAVTGKRLSAGHELRQAAGFVDPLILAQTPAYRPCLLLLDTARCITLPIFRTRGGWGSTGSPVGVSRGRAIVHVTTDDDGAGHSGWPRYLFAADKTGHNVWQYPRQLIFPGMSEKTDWGHYESIEQAALLPNAGMLVALSSRGQFVGIRADGSVAWRTRPGSQDIPSVLSIASFQRGCFVLIGTRPGASATAVSHLNYVNARTGAIRQIAILPATRRIWVQGTELFVLTGTPAVETYNCETLVSSTHRARFR